MAESVGKKSRYVYSDSDFAIISEEVSAGNGHRAIFAKYVTNRKYGAKKWSLGGWIKWQRVYTCPLVCITNLYYVIGYQIRYKLHMRNWGGKKEPRKYSAAKRSAKKANGGRAPREPLLWLNIARSGAHPETLTCNAGMGGAGMGRKSRRSRHEAAAPFLRYGLSFGPDDVRRYPPRYRMSGISRRRVPIPEKARRWKSSRNSA